MPMIRPSPRISRMKSNFRSQLGETLAKFGAALADIFQQLRFFDGVQKFESGGADERPAAEGGAMQAGRDARGHSFGSENRAERQTGGQRLGDYDDIRLGRKFLIGKITPGAAKAALNFVGDQQRAMLRGERAGTIPESFGGGMDAAFALNGFEDHGAHGVVKFRFEVGDVVEVHKLDTRAVAARRAGGIFPWR